MTCLKAQALLKQFGKKGEGPNNDSHVRHASLVRVLYQVQGCCTFAAESFA